MLQQNLPPEYQTPIQHVQQPQTVDQQKKFPQPELQFDLQFELEQLADLILDATRIPLTELVVVDEAKILERLDIINANLPPELASAVEVLQRQRKIITEAENYARQLVRLAEEKATAIIQESAIVSQAQLEAARITTKAEEECLRLRQETKAEIEQWRQMAIAECQEIQVGADRYADEVLSNVEQQCQDILTVIQNGRQQLNNQ